MRTSCQYKKVLIIQTAFIGDVVLATPLARALKEGLRDSQVHFVAIPYTVNLLESNPSIDRIIVYDKRGRDRGLLNLVKFASALKEQKYGVAIIPHRSLRSALIALLARIPQRIGFDSSAGHLFLTQKVSYRQDLHEAERNLQLLNGIGLHVNAYKPEIYPDEKDVKVIDRWLSLWGIAPDDDLIGMAPGSVWATKRWPKERFAKVAEKLISSYSAKIVLVGGQQDRPLCAEISAMINNEVFDACGKLSLRQSAELISRCRVFLSNDSAPIHLAAAMGTPVVAIFGPTVPQFGFYPYGEGHIVIEKDLPCRPCGIHGGKRCPTKTFECMKSITVAEVIEAVVTINRRSACAEKRTDAEGVCGKSAKN